MNAKANNTKEKVQQLQRKLYRSAKENKKRRFHSLYDKLWREDVLTQAWKQVKKNRGSAGIDKITLSEIEVYGVELFLKETANLLKGGNYHPKAVRRTYIDKSDGRKRPLGIPTVQDRVVQTAVKLMIEPIFETDFEEFSYGFRPKRSQHEALKVIRKHCNNKGWWVLDADIKNYFERINHDKLMLLVEQRINDRRILKLIRKWLKAGVMEEGKLRQSLTGTPQGGVISPLLSNIYLGVLDELWTKHYSHLGNLVRFADDFVVVCRTKKDVEHAYKAISLILKKLELDLHPKKTRMLNLWDGKEGFDFLGMHHRKIKQKSRHGHEYTVTVQRPSNKAMSRMRERIREELKPRNRLYMEMDAVVKKLNPVIIGWRNYYKLPLSESYLRKLDYHIFIRFTIWYNKKHQINKRHSNKSLVNGKLRQLKLAKLVY